MNQIGDVAANAVPFQYFEVDCCWKATSTVETPLPPVSAAVPHVSPPGVEQPAFQPAVVYDVAVGNVIDSVGAPRSSFVVVSAVAGAASRLPALSTAIV